MDQKATTTNNVLEGYTVLVVDDDPVSRELFGAILVEMGAREVKTAIDGREAVSMMAAMKASPDLLICDIFMPEMDGMEFLNQLVRQQFRGQVVLTTGIDPEMLNIARTIAFDQGLQMRGVVLKPVSLENLAALFIGPVKDSLVNT